MLTQPRADIGVRDVTVETAATSAPIRFRGATLDDAIRIAEESLGARTRVVSANQLRRGGIGGFFASDLGVEISVVVEDETVEDALARIVHEAAAEERDAWRDRDELLDAVAAPIGAGTSFANALRTFEEQTAPVTRPAPMMDERARAFTDQACAAPQQPVAQPVPVQQPVVQQPVVQQPVVQQPVVQQPAFPVQQPVVQQPVLQQPVVQPVVADPNQQQADLVVAATEQLLGGVANRSGAGEYSVKVVVRSKEGLEVVASASFTSREGR